MMLVPTKQTELIPFALDLIEKCRVSVGMRASYYRLLNIITETGRYDGNKSLINMMFQHLDRASSLLYSSTELKLALDFDNVYPKTDLDRAAVVAKHLTRSWERNNTDILFGQGVFEALKYGACILKQWVQVEGKQEKPVYYKKLVMPWQFGVYNEAENDISKQSAVCETTQMTLPEIWRRIWHLQNAEKLFDRIKSHAHTGGDTQEATSFFHQVLSTSQLDTGVNGSTRQMPGGIVTLNMDPNFAVMGPQIAADTVQVHELWVQDEEDYTTIIMVEPDIVIAPLFKKMNLLGVEEEQPYRLIQPNAVSNWFWGRSELVDLIEPQALLSVWLDDMKRLTGLQVDKILGFIGEDGMTDERYGQMRAAGYLSMGPNGKIQDLTPALPPELLEAIKFIMQQINMLGSFPEILRGQGEAGVRAGVHADTLLKTASPTLRDRALIVERQVANSADLTLQIREAKDSSTYWTDGDTIEKAQDSAFHLTDLPADWRVTVDSHSSSPLFANEAQQLIMALLAKGVVTPEYVIDNMPIPDKETAKAQYKANKAAQQQQMQNLLKQYPEAAEKLAIKMVGGGKR